MFGLETSVNKTKARTKENGLEEKAPKNENGKKRERNAGD